MEKIGLNEIRKKFIEFYVNKNHYPKKSASLVPKSDKSLLLINSGMAPLKPYFSGEIMPPSKRMVTCQKCVRTGDIENVGKTSRHGTFFEMLGNFSFGDYFKKESLTWGWEFITGVLKLPKERLWVTVYLDDDEAYEIWKSLDVPEDRIVRLGKEDNFWEIGLGPCGPCSEIYYDRGEDAGCSSKDCKPGCDCDRYVEFWNHVFTQFSKDEKGNYLPLEHPNIDTGMGLERIACIMQGVDSIFDIDTIKYILGGVVEKARTPYEDGLGKNDISIRIITDHLRSTVFLISDGVVPSNEGRGYVLRRLIRRASRHGKLLGIRENFLYELANRVIKVSGEYYPKLVENADYIKKVIESEENKFNLTIDQGTEIISKYIRELKEKNQKVLKAEDAFKLYDTFGFPIELTEEILEEEGMKADTKGFELLMEKQKETARAGRKDTEGEAWKEVFVPENLNPTEFLGYETLECKGNLINILTEDGLKVELEAKGNKVRAKLFFDKTPFYAESGGQIYDTGKIYSLKDKEIKIEVIKVTKSKGIFIHDVNLIEGQIRVGDTLELLANRVRRNMIARNHTATHLLHKALKETLGEHVNQAGSFVGEKTLRFDFTHFQGMTKEEVVTVEKKVNHIINMFLPITTEEMSVNEAIKKGATALFDEKYGENVRVVSCNDYSVELCGGTHLENSGQVGAFKIIKESGAAAGVRRIEAVTGLGIYELESKRKEQIFDIASFLKCRDDLALERVKEISQDLKDTKKELNDLKNDSLDKVTESLIKQGEKIKGITLITHVFDNLDQESLRNISDEIKEEIKEAVILLATTNDEKINFILSITDVLVQKGLNAGKIIKEVAKPCKGGGGGKADMAQAGGKDSKGVAESFDIIKSILENFSK